MTKLQKETGLKLLKMFQVDGVSAAEAFSEGRFEMFCEMVFRKHKRVHIMTSTQFGKSLVVAIACIVITCIMGEMVAVVAPTNDKARIISRYYLDHLGDHPSFEKMLEKETKLDRLRMEETKERIVLRNGGGIFIISAQAGNSQKGIESAMGAGAKNVIMDEACLIPDTIEATVFRMIAGKGEDAFYCKIGNPFYRNHFWLSFNNPEYHKINIDYKQALREGRYNEKFIEEARRKPFFSVLFENRFPNEGMFDEKHFLKLIPENRITVFPKLSETPWFGQKLLGIDPAGEGKDTATFCVRDRFKAEIVHEIQSTNPRQIAEVALTLIASLKIDPRDVIVDAMGIGADVGKEIALASKGAYNVYTVLVGNRPKSEEDYNGHFFQVHDDEKDGEEDIYLNLRALMYFRAKDWLFAGGQVVDENTDQSAFKNELGVIKYKRSLQGNKIQLMSKKDMLQQGVASPNKADAFALTFLRDIDTNVQSKEEIAAIRDEEDDVTDPYSAL